MDQWRDMREEWNQLLHESAVASFFLTWEWLYSWAQVCLTTERTLWVLLLRDKSRLVGIAPLYLAIDRSGPLAVRELRYIGTPESGADYIDVICAKGYEKKIANDLFNYLNGDMTNQWDQLTLSDIRADSLFLINFEMVIEEKGKASTLNRSSYCPVVELPESEEALYAAMSPGWRKKFKQDSRVAQRDYQLSHQQVRGADVADALTTFFELYQEKGGRSVHPVKPIIQNLMDKYTEQAPLQLDTLVIDGTDVAALLHFEYRDTLYMYLMAVDKEYNPKISFGNILVGMVLINALKTGCRFYDFLKGTERYKFHWASTGYRTLTFQFRQRRFSTVSLSFLETHRQLAKLILR
jgi:CelD/BcsL family acetyltransferase involved in cellulose biosynthesis